ncbi:hypothetical protein BGX23_003061, partial [Mortierella sp. AD031]
MVLFPVRSTIMKATGNPLYDQDKGIYMIPMLATNGTEELKPYIDLPKGSQRSISEPGQYYYNLSGLYKQEEYLIEGQKIVSKKFIPHAIKDADAEYTNALFTQENEDILPGVEVKASNKKPMPTT